jgi:hypothetical protein
MSTPSIDGKGKMMRRPWTILGVLACVMVLGSGPAFAGTVVIHEIYYNSPGSDDGSNKSLNAEWIQLHNVTSHSISMTGYTVRDVVGHVYTFGTYTLGAGKSVKIHTGSGTNSPTDRYWNHGWYIWNNDMDTATLKGAKGGTLDTCSYNNSGTSYKIC